MKKNNLLRDVFIALTVVSIGSFLFLESIDYGVYAEVSRLQKLESNLKETVTLIEIDFIKSIINTILNIVKV